MRAILDGDTEDGVEAIFCLATSEGVDLVYPVTASIAFAGTIPFDIVFDNTDDMAEQIEARLNVAMAALDREIIPRGGMAVAEMLNGVVMEFEFADTGKLYGTVTALMHMPVAATNRVQ